MRLALIGDIHTYRLFVPPWKLIGKALVGQTNLWLNRRHHFQRELLRPVLQRVAEIDPDMLLLSGDLTTTAVQGEFHDVADALGPLMKRVPTVIVPGNHDRYTFESLRKQRIERVFPDQVPTPFPHVRPLADRWRLLALDASVPRAWTSRGKLGPRQLGLATEFLESVEPDEGVVVLCHYPFGIPAHLPPMKWHHMLSDAEPLCDALGKCRGRVLYLHGHIHQPWRWQPTEMPRVIDINAGAPCLVNPVYTHGQGFWEIQLPEKTADDVLLKHHVPNADGWDARTVV